MNSIQSYNRYSDALTLKRRRMVIKRLALFIFIGLALAMVTGYLLFFTPYLQITDVSVNGLRTIAPEEVESLMDSVPIGRQAAVFQNIFSVFKFINIRQQKNIIFFDVDTAQDKILAQFPVIKSVAIRKDYPHKLTFDLVERSPIGTWCFNDKCRYFDDDGVLWGRSLRSSGSLLLIVEDKRGDIDTPDRIGLNLLDGINTIIAGFDNIGIRIKNIEIPAGSINDLKVYAAEGYYILTDSSSNMDTQLDTLRIFLKNKDTNFHPEYIDIRIEGRVYYK